MRIWGKDLDPQEISARLGVPASYGHRRGDPRNGKGRWPEGIWTLTSEEQVGSTDLQQHIEWLLDRLEPVRDSLQALLAGPAYHADVFCFWESATGHGGPAFSAAFLRRFAVWNLDLGLDVYFAEPDEVASEQAKKNGV